MKNKFVGILLVIVISFAFPHRWEMGIEALDSNGDYHTTDVRLFTYDNIITPYRIGMTLNSSVGGEANGCPPQKLNPSRLWKV